MEDQTKNVRVTWKRNEYILDSDIPEVTLSIEEEEIGKIHYGQGCEFLITDNCLLKLTTNNANICLELYEDLDNMIEITVYKEFDQVFIRANNNTPREVEIVSSNKPIIQTTSEGRKKAIIITVTILILLPIFMAIFLFSDLLMGDEDKELTLNGTCWSHPTDPTYQIYCFEEEHVYIVQEYDGKYITTNSERDKLAVEEKSEKEGTIITNQTYKSMKFKDAQQELIRDYRMDDSNELYLKVRKDDTTWSQQEKLEITIDDITKEKDITIDIQFMEFTEKFNWSNYTPLLYTLNNINIPENYKYELYYAKGYIHLLTEDDISNYINSLSETSGGHIPSEKQLCYTIDGNAPKNWEGLLDHDIPYGTKKVAIKFCGDF